MISNSLLYTADGLVPPKSDDKTIFIVGQSFSQFEKNDKKQYAIDRIKQIPAISDIEVENLNEITIDELSGYEIIAYGIDAKTNNKKLVYQVILYSDGAYYLLIGTAIDNLKENLGLFKQVCKTFRRK